MADFNYDDYVRGVHPPRKHAAEHPKSRGEAGLKRIWARIRPSLVERGLADVPEDLPSDISKWAVMPDWVELMEKYPFRGRNVFDWLDSWVPDQGHTFRDGAMTLRRIPGHDTARAKQYGQGLNDPTPAFTFHGDRMDYDTVGDMLRKKVKQIQSSGEYANEEFARLDEESLDGWNSAMGGRCGAYVFAESSILFTGMTPHQETGAPIPWDIFWESWKEALDREFPGVREAPPLRPKNLFVGVGSSPGIKVQNMEGSGGYPGSNKSREQLQEYLGRDRFKGRATKGVVFPPAMRESVEWIEAGMPMSGPEYEKVAQPATLAFRGDREVDLDIRALASRGPDSKYHPAADQLAAILPGRSVIIVPTALVLLQSLWGQPLGDHIAGAGTPGFDWVDPWHSSDRLDQIRRKDLNANDGLTASVGADASGWDRDVTPQMHAGETAWYCAMFPEDVSLLYVDADLPIDVTDEWVAGRMQSSAKGKAEPAEVTGIRRDGVEVTLQVTTRPVTFNFHEMVCKVMTMVNDSPIRWANYEVDAPGVEYDLSGALPRLKGLTIISNGGRRSGDGVTGIGNSWSNVVVSGSGAKMSRSPELRKVVARRAKLQGEEPGQGFYSEDLFSRGDDLAILLKLTKKGLIPSVEVASSICSVGLRANAKKQEASDIPGKPVFGFANVLVTEDYMGKLIGRSAKRGMIQESSGLDLDTMEIIKEEKGDLDVELGLMTTTATAKSRMAPLAGFPLLDTHPLAEWWVEFMVHQDKYRLSYITEDSIGPDGTITDVGRELVTRAKEVEARAQARLRAKRENVSVDLDELQAVYIDSTVHGIIEDIALDENYQPVRKMEDTSNLQAFKDRVATR